MDEDAVKNDQYTCELCGQGDMASDEMKSHMYIYHIDTEQTKCPFCNITGTFESISHHIEALHGDYDTPESSPAAGVSVDNGIVLENCPLCDHKASLDSLNIHMNTKHSDVLSLRVPGSASTEDQGPRPSPEGAESSPNPLNNDLELAYPCPFCGLEGLLLAEMETHIFFEHSEDCVSAETELCPDLGPVSEILNESQKQAQQLRDIRQQHSLVRSQDGGRQSSIDSYYNNSVTNDSSNTTTTTTTVNNTSPTTNNGDTKNNLLQSSTQASSSVSSAYVDSGATQTSGIIVRLRGFLSNGPYPSVLSMDCDHFHGDWSDRGWGCGYRNLQMLLTSLQHYTESQQLLFNGYNAVPSLRRIQQLIEKAWRSGFDPDGCQQLQGTLVETKKWIGATEIFTFLSSLKIKSKLIDFHCAGAVDGTHPHLFQWVKQYFDGELTDIDGSIYNNYNLKPPLYLQHHGHSRTIVGYETMKWDQIRLLIFDPGLPQGKVDALLTSKLDWDTLKCIRKPIHFLKHKQYQIVAVTGVLTDHTMELCKMVTSIQIP